MNAVRKQFSVNLGTKTTDASLILFQIVKVRKNCQIYKPSNVHTKLNVLDMEAKFYTTLKCERSLNMTYCNRLNFHWLTYQK